MPDITATHNVLRQHIESNFSAVPIVWENMTFDPVVDGGEAGFVEVCISYDVGEQISFGSPGSNLHRDSGEVEMVVMVPIDTLPAPAIARAQTLRNLFLEGNQFADIAIRSRSILKGYRGGPQSRWWCVPVIIDFTTDYLA